MCKDYHDNPYLRCICSTIYYVNEGMQIFIVMVSIPTLKYIIQLNNQQRVTTNYCARQGIANICVITPFFPIYIYMYILGCVHGSFYIMLSFFGKQSTTDVLSLQGSCYCWKPGRERYVIIIFLLLSTKLP